MDRFFGGGGARNHHEDRRGPNINLDLDVTLEELYNGKEMDVRCVALVLLTFPLLPYEDTALTMSLSMNFLSLSSLG